jgi:hypothetical protein
MAPRFFQPLSPWRRFQTRRPCSSSSCTHARAGSPASHDSSREPLAAMAPMPLLFHGARQELLPWPPTPYSPPWPALELHSSPWRPPPWRSLPTGEQAGSSSPPPFLLPLPSAPSSPRHSEQGARRPCAAPTPSSSHGRAPLYCRPNSISGQRSRRPAQCSLAPVSPLVAHELLGPTSARSMSMAPSSSPLPVHGRQPLLLFTEPSSSSLPLPRSLVAQRAPSSTCAASCALLQQP